MSTYVHSSRSGSLSQRIMHWTGVHFLERERRRGEVRMRASWGELVLGGRIWSLQVGAKLIDWGTDRDSGYRYSLQIRLPLVNLFLSMPGWFWRSRKRTPTCGEMHSWGLETHSVDAEFSSQLYANWGSRSWFIDLPWATRFYRRSVLLKSGAWHHDYERDRLGVHRARLARRNRLRALVGLPAVPDPREGETWWVYHELQDKLNLYTESHDYTYVLRSGEAQDVGATITVQEWETRRRWLWWCPLGARVRRSIDVKFSGEVGERAGSWKGGTVGCGWDMLPGELPVHALRRMERERKFN